MIENKAQKIDFVSPEVIVPWDKNANQHSNEQIERLCKIIEHNGFRDPLIISKRSGFLICGHGRLICAKKLKLETVPVIYQDFRDEAEEYQFMVAHNAIASWAELDLSAVNTEMLELGPDFDIDMLGIKDFVIEPIEKFEPQADEDEVPEVIHPITRKGDVWILGNHRLMCGDSTMIDDVEKLMNGEKADMVFTDPPYNIGFKPQRGTHEIIKNDDMSDGEFRDFLSSVFINCKIALKENTYLISFMSWSTIQDFNFALKDLFEIKSMPIWIKNNFGIGYYTRPKYEPFYLCLNGKPEKPISPPADVFEYAKVHKTIHSCEKPIEMILGITNHFNNGGLFYEPFAGSGSMLIACEKTNRKCYGMELDEKYCDVIINRWQNYTGKKATLKSNGQTYEELKAERENA